MQTIFLSDLHLQAQDVDNITRFCGLLDSLDTNTDAIYILGDLFEAWLGDDDNSQFAQKIKQHMTALTKRGIPGYIMQGNRDFLLGKLFCQETGFHLIVDPTVINLYGCQTVLMHGDTLCTDDHAYQKARKKARCPDFQKSLLSKPLWLRRVMAWYYRRQSKKHTKSSNTQIMDANPQAVAEVYDKYQVELLIHGHTHRPSIDYYDKNKKRVVLSDWHQKGNILVYLASGKHDFVYYDSVNELTEQLFRFSA